MNIQKWFKAAVCALLSILIFQCGMLSALADKSDESDEVKVPILLYHNITSYDSTGDIANISANDFENNIKAIVNAGYNVIKLSDYIDYVRGEKELPEKPLVITFDDGYLSNYEIAYPILKRYGLPATIFVVTGTVGERAEDGKVNNSHFSWVQAMEMQQSGLIDIESHTLSHVDLSKMSKSDIQKELRMSKFMIEKYLGKTCEVIAFPYGGYDEKLVPLAELAGYRVEVLVDDRLSSDPSYANVKWDGLHSIKRLTVIGGTNGTQLLRMIRNTVGE